ncbi:MAG: hypothetical protein ACK42Z_09530 [Candidatus Kapaibacteriota bacterium]
MFALLFGFVGGNKAKADCPPGWEEHRVTALYTYNYGEHYFSCYFTIVYCCRWNNDLKTVEKIIDYVYPNYDSWCWLFIRDWWHFNDWVHTTVGEASAECTPPYPPCDDENNPYYEIQVIAYNCWYFENWQPYVGDDYVCRRVRCEGQTNYCKKTWRVCIDYSVNPPVVRRYLVSSEQYGQPECSTTRPELPPDGDSRWEEYWITNCFAEPCQ